jgi:hypothetical protein
MSRELKEWDIKKFQICIKNFSKKIKMEKIKSLIYKISDGMVKYLCYNYKGKLDLTKDWKFRLDQLRDFNIQSVTTYNNYSGQVRGQKCGFVIRTTSLGKK